MTDSATDVLTYIQDLESSGLPRQQAEAIVRNSVGIMEQSLSKLVTSEQFALRAAHEDQQFAATRERFEHIDRRFDEVDRRFEHIDERFDVVDRRFEQVDKRLDLIDGRFEQMDKRLDLIDGRFEQMDKRLDLIDGRFEQIDRRFDSIDGRFTSVYDELRHLGEMIRAQGESQMAASNAIASDMRVMKVMMAILTITVVIPTLTRWFNP